MGKCIKGRVFGFKVFSPELFPAVCRCHVVEIAERFTETGSICKTTMKGDIGNRPVGEAQRPVRVIKSFFCQIVFKVFMEIVFKEPGQVLWSEI